MNRRFPSDFFLPQKEQTGSNSEPEPDRSQNTTRVRRIGLTPPGVTDSDVRSGEVTDVTGQGPSGGLQR
jgi:hypothetical protein